MSLTEAVAGMAKKVAVNKAVNEAKKEALNFVNGVAVEPAITGAVDSIKGQIDIDKVTKEVEKDLNIDINGIKDSLGLNQLQSEASKAISVNNITADFNFDNAFSDIDFSELEAQGVDTSEIKKAIADAKAELGSMNLDQSIDLKSFGLDIDTNTLKGLSSDNIKEKINAVVKTVKSASSNVNAGKTFTDVAATVKSQMPTNVNVAVNEMKSEANSTVASVQSTVRSMASSFSGFGGFRR